MSTKHSNLERVVVQLKIFSVPQLQLQLETTCFVKHLSCFEKVLKFKALEGAFYKEMNTVYDIAVNTAELQPLHAAHCAAEKVWCAGDCSEPLPPSAASSE